MAIAEASLRTFVADRLVARNPVSRALFDKEADRLAAACEEMAGRFLRGGRLIAFGRGAATTDAQHVSVEFVHPVIVGKRALPALDVSAAFERWVPAIVEERDIVMGFAGPHGDEAVEEAIDVAQACGAQTFALAGPRGSFAVEAPSRDGFISQELIEILYHTLWETVHVFFEHREGGHGDVGASAFLYPYLGDDRQDTSEVAAQVAASIRAKAAEDERLREEVASGESGRISEAIAAVARQLESGGRLLFFGNGGSATDANDWAIDCVSGAPSHREAREAVALTSGRRNPSIPAVSLSMEPANATAIANDIGAEAIFLRQLIAHGRRGDVAVAISTSGGSANVIAALDEARKQGLLTMALLGYDGGEIVRRGLVDLPIVVHCDYIPRIQEVQASIYHVMTEAWLR